MPMKTLPARAAGLTSKFKGVNLSFFTKVFLFSTMLVLLSMAAISAIIYGRMNAVLDTQNEVLMRYSTSEIRTNVENYIASMESVANTIYSDVTVWELLQKGAYTNDYIRFQKHLTVENMIQNLSNGSNIVKSVQIYNNNITFTEISKYFRNKKEFPRQDLLEKAVEADGRSVWATYVDTSGALRVLLLKDINIYQPGGVLVMEMNMAALNSMYDIYTSNDNKLFLLDSSFTVINTNDHAALASLIPLNIQEDMKQGRLYTKVQYKGSTFYSYFEDIKGFWKIVMLYNYEDIEQQKTQTGRYILISAALFTVAGLLFSLFFSRRFTSKLERLVKKIKRIERGDLNMQPDAGRHDEFYALDKTLCTMARRVDSLTAEIVRAEKMKNESEIKYLQTQINPHFLYNQLSAARWMAVQNSQDSIVFIIDNLCNFYRLALSRGSDVVKLKVELGLIESYVALQNLCYTEKINLFVSIEKGLENMDICKMTLQPFVENSILHGKIHGRELNIRIEAERAGCEVRLSVTDDGYGVPEDVVAYVNALNGSSGYEFDRYFGITNTYTRLNLYCGGRARIRVFNCDQGAGVEFMLPLPQELAAAAAEESA